MFTTRHSTALGPLGDSLGGSLMTQFQSGQSDESNRTTTRAGKPRLCGAGEYEDDDLPNDFGKNGGA